MSNKSGFQLKGSGPEIYEICWVPALMGKCAADLVEAGEVKSGDRILDVGCGTGVVAREAAHRCGAGGSVTGVDVNEPMMDVAKNIARELGMQKIEWRQCDASSLPFEDASFDVVFCQQGLQFMPDKPAAMNEMTRVLSPGGRLAVSVWKTSSPFGTALCKVLDKHFGKGTTTPWQVAYSLGNRNELRTLATDSGLSEAHVQLDIKMARHAKPDAFVLGAIIGSPLAGEFEMKAEADQKAIVQEILEEIEDCMDDGGLAISAECHTLTGRK